MCRAMSVAEVSREPIPRIVSFKAEKDDLSLMEQLQKKLGIKQQSTVIRMGLRCLAEKEGIAA